MIGVKGYIRKAIWNYNNVEGKITQVTYYYNEELFNEIIKHIQEFTLNACKGYFVSKDMKFGNTEKNKNIKEEMTEYVLKNAELGKYISKIDYYKRNWVFYSTCENRSITDKQFAVRYFREMVDEMKETCDYLIDVVADMRGSEHVKYRNLYR